MRAPWLACLAAGMACHGEGGGKHKASPGSASSTVELVTPDAGAAATSGDEVEPNDTDAQATPLPLGGTLRGRIDPEGDVDRYRIAVTSAGALSVMVSAVDADLAFELEDGSGAVIAKSDRGGVRAREGVPNVGVVPGTYTAVVRAVKKKRKRGSASDAPAPVYEITAQLTQPVPNAEREPNDARGSAPNDNRGSAPNDHRGSATELIVGDTGTGYIGWTGDVDVWKLSVEALSAKDALDIELSPVDGVGYDVEVDDGSGAPLLHRKTPRGVPMIVRGLVPVEGSGAPPMLYIAIKGAGSNPEAPYALRVTGHVLGTDAEVEPDDTPDHAFPWPADRTVVHATWTPGDVDCYALPQSASARDVSLAIDPPSDVALIAELLVDDKPIAASAGGGKGVAQKVSGTVPANARAIVRVKGADERASTEGSYDLTLQDGS